MFLPNASSESEQPPGGQGDKGGKREGERRGGRGGRREEEACSHGLLSWPPEP